MRIVSIETMLLDQLVVVRVRTSDGVEGIGQAAPYQPTVTTRVIHEMVAPIFLGKSPWEVDRLVDQCVNHQYKFTGSFLLRAVCGVETALWDILGKVTNLPVSELLGAQTGTTLDVYGSSMLRSTSPQQEVERLASAVENYGFKGVKLRVGMPMGRDSDASPSRSEQLIPLAREVLGDSVAISADANGGYSVAEAVRIGRMLEEYRYFHYEEPVPYMDIDGTKYINHKLDMPVAAGEQETSLLNFHRLIFENCVDIIQPDVGYLGGISRMHKVADMAVLRNIPFTPHCANDSLLQVFTLHLAAAMPGATQRQEWSIEDRHWFSGVYEPMLEVHNGKVELPDNAGWGIELTEHFIGNAIHETSHS